MTDKERAEHCSFFIPAGAFIDDHGMPTCTAHLGEGEIFNCAVWLGKGHLNRNNPLNLCVDGLLNIPKEILRSNQ